MYSNISSDTDSEVNLPSTTSQRDHTDKLKDADISKPSNASVHNETNPEIPETVANKDFDGASPEIVKIVDIPSHKRSLIPDNAEIIVLGSDDELEELDSDEGEYDGSIDWPEYVITRYAELASMHTCYYESGDCISEEGQEHFQTLLEKYFPDSGYDFSIETQEEIFSELVHEYYSIYQPVLRHHGIYFSECAQCLKFKHPNFESSGPRGMFDTVLRDLNRDDLSIPDIQKYFSMPLAARYMNLIGQFCSGGSGS